MALSLGTVEIWIHQVTQVLMLVWPLTNSPNIVLCNFQRCFHGHFLCYPGWQNCCGSQSWLHVIITGELKTKPDSTSTPTTGSAHRQTVFGHESWALVICLKFSRRFQCAGRGLGSLLILPPDILFLWWERWGSEELIFLSKFVKEDGKEATCWES